MPLPKDLVIEQGSTYAQVVRWEAAPTIYKPITAITQTAPVQITAVGHGLPPGWRAAVIAVKGMSGINAPNVPPKDKDYHPVTVVGNDTIQLNDVSAANLSAYVSGGYLQFNTPVDLTGYTARMTIKDKVGGTMLLSLTTANNRIVIDTSNHKITLTITATDTALITWSKGVYDLELVSATGVVTALMAGSVTVIDEVTT